MKIGKQISYIVIISLFLGLFRNFLLVEPIQFIKKPRDLKKISLNIKDTNSVQFTIPELLTEPMLVGYAEVEYLYNNENCIFIDARDSVEYKSGHIKGAINIPFDFIENYEEKILDIDEETILITYCNGGDCDLSVDLADYLMKDYGFFNVLIYEGGWPEWKDNFNE